MLFTVGVGMPVSRCSIWNRRTSSAVAVSGERPRMPQSVLRPECSCAASDPRRRKQNVSSRPDFCPGNPIPYAQKQGKFAADQGIPSRVAANRIAEAKSAAPSGVDSTGVPKGWAGRKDEIAIHRENAQRRPSRAAEAAPRRRQERRVEAWCSPPYSCNARARLPACRSRVQRLVSGIETGIVCRAQDRGWSKAPRHEPVNSNR
jgi:hypothetical protein